MTNANNTAPPACQFSTTGRVLTITVGLPASGKSTFAEKAGFDTAVSLDDCREILWGDKRIQHGPGGIDALLALQETIIRAAMKENKSIIVHNTSILKEHRKPLVQLAKEQGYRTQIIYFDVPAAECIKRNQHRDGAVPPGAMEYFIANMEVPTEDEADRVVRYNMIREKLAGGRC